MRSRSPSKEGFELSTLLSYLCLLLGFEIEAYLVGFLVMESSALDINSRHLFRRQTARKPLKQACPVSSEITDAGVDLQCPAVKVCQHLVVGSKAPSKLGGLAKQYTQLQWRQRDLVSGGISQKESQGPPLEQETVKISMEIDRFGGIFVLSPGVRREKSLTASMGSVKQSAVSAPAKFPVSVHWFFESIQGSLQYQGDQRAPHANATKERWRLLLVGQG